MFGAVTVAAVLCLAGASWAADNLRHPELQRFVDEGGKVEFLGNAYGLDGWVISKEGLEPAAVYTTKEGGLVRGMLVSPDGANETMNQLIALKARLGGSQAALPGAENAHAPRVEKFYAEVEKAPWAEAGNKDAPYLYFFMNVTCDDCQKAWRDMQPMINAGKLRVRLAPFGAKQPNRDGGAALLSAAEPQKAWNDFIDGKKEALDAGAAVDGSREAVDFNSKLLASWGVKSSPFILYRRLTDGKIMAINGRPENTMLLMADLTPPLAPAAQSTVPASEKAAPVDKKKTEPKKK
jgi:hypothetical protein